MRLGVIGGTGLIAMGTDGFESHGISVKQHDNMVVETPFGPVPLNCMTLDVNGVEKELIFLQRHHSESGHGCPPHMINHHANIMAMQDAGVDLVLSVCSVGAIAPTFQPGKVAVANQYIDFTGVTTTFHSDESVFTSVTQPFDRQTNERLIDVLRSEQSLDPSEPMMYTYWLAQGPQFETVAEVNAIERLGGEMVGMTMPREAKLAKELDLPYVAVCISSNWAAGREPGDGSKDLNHTEVSAQANDRLGPVRACILALLK